MAFSGSVSVPSGVGKSIDFVVTGTHTLQYAQAFSDTLNTATTGGGAGVTFHDLGQGGATTGGGSINEYTLVDPSGTLGYTGMSVTTGGGYTFIDVNGLDTVVGSGAGDQVLVTGVGAQVTYVDKGGSNQVGFTAGNNVYDGSGQTSADVDTIVAGSGLDTIATGKYSNLVISGSGSGTFFLNDTVGYGDLVVIDDGTNTVHADGAADTVVASTGGQNIIEGATIPSSSLLVVLENGADARSTAADTVNAFSNVTTVWDYNNTNDNIISGGGTLYFIGGAGGSANITGGSGVINASVNEGGTITFSGGSASVGSATFFAAGTAATIDGSGAHEAATFYADQTPQGAGGDVQDLVGGYGNDKFFTAGGAESLTGGAGNNTFVIDKGFGGSDFGANITITDFGSSAGNFVQFSGYTQAEYQTAINNGTVSGGNFTIQLDDGTKVTFDGVTNINGHY